MKEPTCPTVDYPTILEGRIWADTIRLENLEGNELYLTLPHADGMPIELRRMTPQLMNGVLWGVTHLQKQSRRGWLRVSPDCYHWWWFWKLQEKDEKGNWIPGTERGIYFRKPFSWRWDPLGTVINGVLRHWIWTKGYLGGHWD